MVEIDAATGAVGVTHQMAAHDAEPALTAIAPEVQPNLDDPAALAALVGYVNRCFELREPRRGVAALALRTTDLDGDDVRLVFAGRVTPGAATLSVRSAIFCDLHLDQENQVNVRLAKVTRTALFRPGGEAQTIDFSS